MGHSRVLCRICKWLVSKPQKGYHGRLQNFDSVAILQMYGHWGRNVAGAEKAKSLRWGWNRGVLGRRETSMVDIHHKVQRILVMKRLCGGYSYPQSLCGRFHSM